MIEAAILVIFPFAMANAAMSDMMSMTIANRVSLLLVGSFIVLAPLTGMGLFEFGMHFAAMAVVLAACFGLFAFGVMGGGDGKLMASTALWLGMSYSLMEYLLIGSMLGGLVTLLILSYRKSPMAVYVSRIDFMHRLANPKEKIPYGIALGTAGLIVFPSSVLGTWVIERLTSL
jgi:prepilin peptidase CpaA